MRTPTHWWKMEEAAGVNKADSGAAPVALTSGSETQETGYPDNPTEGDYAAGFRVYGGGATATVSVPTVSESFTIAARVKYDNFATAAGQGGWIIEDGNLASYLRFALWAGDTAVDDPCHFQLRVTDHNTLIQTDLVHSTGLEASRWYTVIAGYKASTNQIWISVDGQPPEYGNVPSGSAFVQGQITVGGTQGLKTLGDIDDVILDYYEWSQSDIDQFLGNVCGLLKYGDYEFPVTFYTADDGLEWNLPVAQLPRAHGGRAQTPYLRPRRLVVRGGIIGIGPIGATGDLGASLDELLAALGAQPQDLHYGDGTFVYRDVHCEGMTNPYQPTWPCRIAGEIAINFLAQDPLRYSIFEYTDTWSGFTSGDQRSLTVAGAVFAIPVIVFTVPGSGAKTISWQIENVTTGEIMALTSETGGVTGGDVITVDCRAQTVTIGAVDRMDLIQGQWLTLAVGANTLEYTLNLFGGIDPDSIAVTWRPRKW